MCPSFKFSLFGFLDLYTIFMLVGIVVCMVLIRVLSDHRKMRAKWQNLVLFNALISVVLGYGSAVLFQAFYNYMDGEPFRLANDTGATFYGGLIGGAVIFIIIYFAVGHFLFPDGYHKKHFTTVVDIAAPCIAAAHGFGRLGCLMAGCCYGPVVSTHEWYGIRMWDGHAWAYRMPVQLFEAVFLFLLCALLIFMFWEKSRRVMACYMLCYGGWRMMAETMRVDDRGATVISALTPSQLISVLLLVGGAALLLVDYIRVRRAKQAAVVPASNEATAETDGSSSEENHGSETDPE